MLQSMRRLKSERAFTVIPRKPSNQEMILPFTSVYRVEWTFKTTGITE